MSGTTHSKLAHPTLIISEENALQAYPQANLVGAFSQLKFPFLKWL